MVPAQRQWWLGRLARANRSQGQGEQGHYHGEPEWDRRTSRISATRLDVLDVSRYN